MSSSSSERGVRVPYAQGQPVPSASLSSISQLLGFLQNNDDESIYERVSYPIYPGARRIVSDSDEELENAASLPIPPRRRRGSVPLAEIEMEDEPENEDPLEPVAEDPEDPSVAIYSDLIRIEAVQEIAHVSDSEIDSDEDGDAMMFQAGLARPSQDVHPVDPGDLQFIVPPALEEKKNATLEKDEPPLFADEAAADEYRCVMCYDVSKDPFMCKTDFTLMCLACIQQWSSSTKDKAKDHVECPGGRCPILKKDIKVSLDTLNNISKLRVSCRMDGCTWVNHLYGKNGETYDAHMKECPYVLVSCPHDGCTDVKLLRRDLPDHQLYKCLKRSLFCPFCKATIPFADLDPHLKTACPKFPVPCMYGCPNTEGRWPKDSIAIDHYAKDCGAYTYTCPHGCEGAFTQAQLVTHDKEAMVGHMQTMLTRALELNYKMTTWVHQVHLQGSSAPLPAHLDHVRMLRFPNGQLSMKGVLGPDVTGPNLSKHRPFTVAAACYSAKESKIFLSVRLDFNANEHTDVRGRNVHDSRIGKKTECMFVMHTSDLLNPELKLTDPLFKPLWCPENDALFFDVTQLCSLFHEESGLQIVAAYSQFNKRIGILMNDHKDSTRLVPYLFPSRENLQKQEESKEGTYFLPDKAWMTHNHVSKLQCVYMTYMPSIDRLVLFFWSDNMNNNRQHFLDASFFTFTMVRMDTGSWEPRLAFDTFTRIQLEHPRELQSGDHLYRTAATVTLAHNHGTSPTCATFTRAYNQVDHTPKLSSSLCGNHVWIGCSTCCSYTEYRVVAALHSYDFKFERKIFPPSKGDSSTSIYFQTTKDGLPGPLLALPQDRFLMMSYSRDQLLVSGSSNEIVKRWDLNAVQHASNFVNEATEYQESRRFLCSKHGTSLFQFVQGGAPAMLWGFKENPILKSFDSLEKEMKVQRLSQVPQIANREPSALYKSLLQMDAGQVVASFVQDSKKKFQAYRKRKIEEKEAQDQKKKWASERSPLLKALIAKLVKMQKEPFPKEVVSRAFALPSLHPSLFTDPDRLLLDQLDLDDEKLDRLITAELQRLKESNKLKEIEPPDDQSAAYSFASVWYINV